MVSRAAKYIGKKESEAPDTKPSALSLIISLRAVSKPSILELVSKCSERSGDKAKMMKKRSLHVVNKHFGIIFNAVSTSAVILRQVLKI